MDELQSIWDDITGYAEDVGNSIDMAFDPVAGAVSAPVLQAGGTVASEVSDVASDVAATVLPSTSTLLTGSVLLIVILVLVLMILGKFEGIGLGL
jgi:hypothetical protein